MKLRSGLEPNRETARSAVQDLAVGSARGSRRSWILRQIELEVEVGECLGVVGESGSGKSTLLYALIGQCKPGLERLEGVSLFEGRDLFALAPGELQALRGRRLALVPQSSGRTLTPHLRIRTQLDEALRKAPRQAQRTDHDWRHERAVELLETMGLAQPLSVLERYPHQLSGGQLQRVAIALALAGEPDLLLLDEPTSGLDKSTQDGLLDCLRKLIAKRRLSIVCVSHDLDVVAGISQRIAILYAGRIVETGPTGHVLAAPQHPYTQELLDSRPGALAETRPLASGVAQAALPHRAEGCGFAPRCSRAKGQCRESSPPMQPVGDLPIAARCFFPGLQGAAPRATRGAFPRERDPSPLLEIEGVIAGYGGKPAIEDITLEVGRGETLAVVGASGSGKSTLLASVSGLLAPEAGQITLYDSRSGASGLRLGPLRERDLGTLRRIQFVFQNPRSSLNPRQTVEEILMRPLALYSPGPRNRRRERVSELLDAVRLERSYGNRLPGQLSGGELQRVAIARAFAADPDLILCDEITSALDVSLRASMIDLLERLREERGTAYLFVSHELDILRTFADRIAVIREGRIVETGRTAQIFTAPQHQATKDLLAAAGLRHPRMAPTEEKMRQQAVTGRHRLRRRH